MYDALAILPVNSLRVFEAAARLGNFSRAAMELNITTGAVSQQIKKIEARCGVELFERVGREVQLTERGRRLWIGVADGLKALDAAADEAMQDPASAYISISTLGSVAALWLVPRLDRWREHRPDIDIRISTSGELMDLGREQIDLAIRIGGGDYPGLESKHLLRDRIVPVCSPKLLADGPALSRPQDMANHTLVQFAPAYGNVRTDWKGWLEANRVEGVDTDRGLFFNELIPAIYAAISGQGVLLAPSSHVEESLKNGLLVALFGDEGYRPADWFVVTPGSRPVRPHVAEFIDWLLSEAHQTGSS